MIIRNDKKGGIHTIVKQSMRNEKRRNMMVVFAVVLSSFLLSFASMLTTTLIKNQKDRVTDTYEAIYMNISNKDIDKLKNVPEFERVGIYYYAGEERFNKGYSGTFLYIDEPMLYMSRQEAKLIEGKLPYKADEIVISESWIEKYEKDKKIGDTVTLLGDEFSGKYILTGIVETLKSGGEKYPFILSENKLKQLNKYNTSEYRAYVHINNCIQTEEIKEFCNDIAKKENLSVGFNDEYFRYKEKDISINQIIIMLVLGGIVLGGSCIVIQSIFQIFVIEKIQSYGQMRTIGATGKQIKKIIKKEARILAIIGSIIGIIIGNSTLTVIMSENIDIISCIGNSSIVVLFCYCMVMLSVHKPIKTVSQISPIEATKYMYEQRSRFAERNSNRKITPVYLGFLNFMREPKRFISVAISLGFPGVLLLVVSTMLAIQSPERMAYHDFANGDYKVYIESDKNHKDLLEEGNPLNDKFKTEIQKITGVTNISVGRQSAYFRLNYKEMASGGMCDMITFENEQMIKKSLLVGNMPSNNHEVLVMEDYLDLGEEPKIGMKFDLSFGGKKTSVSISGIFSPLKLPIAQGHGEKGLDAPMLYAQNGLFRELLSGIDNYNYSWDISCNSEHTQDIGIKLKKIVSTYTDIDIDSVFDRMATYESNNTAFYGILQSISWIIFLFGAINLVNTTLSNQLSRQHEINILRSLGSTKRQIYLMTICEGICYILSSIIIVFVIGVPTTILVSYQVGKLVYGEPVAYHFSALNMVVYVLIICLLELLLSMWAIKNQKNKSIFKQL